EIHDVALGPVEELLELRGLRARASRLLGRRSARGTGVEVRRRLLLARDVGAERRLQRRVDRRPRALDLAADEAEERDRGASRVRLSEEAAVGRVERVGAAAPGDPDVLAV